MRRFRFIAWLVVGIVALVWLQFGSLLTRSAVNPDSINLHRAIGIAKMCKGYSLDQGGVSPATLNALYASEFWEEADLRQRDYFDSKSKQRMEWMYFPAEDMEPGDDETLFIVSPLAYKGKRVVVFTDLSGRVVREKECEEMLKRQRGG